MVSGSEVRDSKGAGIGRRRVYHAGRPELERQGGELKHHAPGTSTRPSIAATEIIHQSRGVRRKIWVGEGRGAGGQHQVSEGQRIRGVERGAVPGEAEGTTKGEAGEPPRVMQCGETVRGPRAGQRRWRPGVTSEVGGPQLVATKTRAHSAAGGAPLPWLTA